MKNIITIMSIVSIFILGLEADEAKKEATQKRNTVLQTQMKASQGAFGSKDRNKKQFPTKNIYGNSYGAIPKDDTQGERVKIPTH